jgi:hypothetical protein
VHDRSNASELRELIKKRKKPVALFIDEAHGLKRDILVGLKRLMELVRDGGGVLSVVLAGHPKLNNELRRPMEEIGNRATMFSLDNAHGANRDYILSLLGQCAKVGTETQTLFSDESVDLLAERLTTPLQIGRKRAVRPYPLGRGNTGPVAMGGAHSARSPWAGSCTRASVMLAAPRTALILGGRGPVAPFPPGSGFGRSRLRASRRYDRLARRPPPNRVGRKRVSEPRSLLSTTRTTRRLRRWAPEPALATPETRFELL